MKFAKASAALALLALFALPVIAQKTGTIKGKVRVEKGSAGGVAVILSKGEEEIRRVETDRKGQFTIARITPGTYSLTFRRPGLAVAAIDKLEVKSGTRSLKDLILAVDEGSIAFIRGSVFNEGGRSVPGVRVDLARVASESSIEKLDSRVTGETGEFVFRVPPDAAKYRVTLKADGAEAVSKDVDVDAAVVYRVALAYKRKP